MNKRKYIFIKEFILFYFYNTVTIFIITLDLHNNNTVRDMQSIDHKNHNGPRLNNYLFNDNRC